MQPSNHIPSLLVKSIFFIVCNFISISALQANAPVQITSPLNGTSYREGDTVKIQVQTSNPSSMVTAVEFYVNGVFIGKDGTAPYEKDWASVEGTHTLTVKEMIGSCNDPQTSVPVQVIIKKNIAPVVSITSPTTGGTQLSPLLISATANDQDGTVSFVDFFANSIFIGRSSTAPYQLNWNNATGTFILTAQAMDNKGAVSASDSVTITINSVGTPTYLIETIDGLCNTSSFCLPIKTICPINDIIGYDITLHYDKTKVHPTGQVTVSDDLINSGLTSSVVNVVDSLSLMHISIILKSAAPGSTTFNGTGELICVAFEKDTNFVADDNAAFSISTLQESYYNGVSNKTVTPGKYINKKNNSYPARLKFWKGSVPIQYNSADPNQFLISNIYGTDTSCVHTSPPIQPDTLGRISYNLLNGSFLQIQRDILPTSNIQPVINSMDAVLAYAVLLNDLAFIPSIYQLIALDVNMDGTISAGDISQINQRSIATLPEFKQKWNYTNNGTSNGELSKDWLFVDSTLLASPAFKISSTYPSSDGIGYSKSKVPAVPFCLKIPPSLCTTCAVYKEGTLTGILLGDVNGNYETVPVDGKIKKPISGSEQSRIIVDLSKTIKGKGYVDVPVFFSSSEKITGLDFSIQLNSQALSYSKISHAASYLNDAMVSLNEDHILRFTSNSSKHFESGKPVAHIRLSTNMNLSKNDFDGLAGYLNGEAVAIEIKEQVSTNIHAALEDNTVHVHPNPASDLLNVVVVEKSTVQLFDLQGKEVTPELQAAANEKLEIHTENLKTGIYLLKIINAGVTKTQQIVIE